MAGQATLVDMPAEILEEILDNLFKGSVVFIYGKEYKVAVWRAFRGFPLINTCQGLRAVAEDVLASRLSLSLVEGLPERIGFSPHFESFYLPKIKYVELDLNSISNFKLERFPSLATLKIIEKDDSFQSYAVNVDNEGIVAILGGHLDDRLMQKSQNAWKELYADKQIIKWQQILADDKRAFTIIDSVTVKFQGMERQGLTTIGTMVCARYLSIESPTASYYFYFKILTYYSASFSISIRVKQNRSWHGSKR
jgi:hypothetical protein